MNKIDKQYQDLLQDILDNGVEKKDRTGTGTISVFGRQIRHKMSEGFPLLTTKKMPWKSIVTELLWFLQGNTNIKWLVENGCNIWNGDAYKNYVKHNQFNSNPKWLKPIPLENGDNGAGLYSIEEFINKIKEDDEFAKKWGELGPIYGKQWRKWSSISDSDFDMRMSTYEIDQIQNLINDLKTNPDSRRLMVNAWNVGELDQMVLPPCHYGFQVYTRELSLEEIIAHQVDNKNSFELTDEILSNEITDRSKVYEIIREKNIPTIAISLMWNQRSVDTFLGLPFNIASYGLLLMMLADEVNMVPDQLIGNLGDVHLYSNHIEQAKEQIGRKYTHEERTELLKQVMGFERYEKAVDELMPFGGGLSGYYESYKIPYNTREPYPLPTVHVRDGIYCSSIEDVLLFDYESHPVIKAPLSN